MAEARVTILQRTAIRAAAIAVGGLGLAGCAQLPTYPFAQPSVDVTSPIAEDIRKANPAGAPYPTVAQVPDLPQDEILAQLLFKRNVSALSPFELAQIASALASLTGVGPDVGGPLTRVRRALGLDRLSVGTNASGGAALEAGRFVAPGVYVGTKQGVSGGGQATVRIDITKGLTLQGSTSTGGSATGAGGESNGSGVGIGYQFEY